MVRTNQATLVRHEPTTGRARIEGVPSTNVVSASSNTSIAALGLFEYPVPKRQGIPPRSGNNALPLKMSTHLPSLHRSRACFSRRVLFLFLRPTIARLKFSRDRRILSEQYTSSLSASHPVQRPFFCGLSWCPHSRGCVPDCTLTRHASLALSRVYFLKLPPCCLRQRCQSAQCKILPVIARCNSSRPVEQLDVDDGDGATETERGDGLGGHHVLLANAYFSIVYVALLKNCASAVHGYN